MPEPIRKQRSQALHQLADQLKQSWLQQQVGSAAQVLWERRKEEGGRAIYSGYTPNYCKVVHTTDLSTKLENKITAVNLSADQLHDGVLCGH